MCQEASSATQMRMPARALKRQQQRERRKTARAQGPAATEIASAAASAPTTAAAAEAEAAAAAARKIAGNMALEGDKTAENHFSFFELRHPLHGVKCVLKHTFIESYEEACEDETCQDDGPPLDPPLFVTTAGLEDWRKAYRQFRLGSHLGARGEMTAPKGASIIDVGVNPQADSSSCLPWKQETEQASASSSTVAGASQGDDVCCFGNGSESRLRWSDSSDCFEERGARDDLDESGKVPNRALKRQRQRERRRIGRAESRANVVDNSKYEREGQSRHGDPTNTSEKSLFTWRHEVPVLACAPWIFRS
eukprot:TRINITY_DN4347_c0_g2_i1.p1 TRINITY_DN4347_c0_g2~~TRINITY_DN4347_c0_g2_i1.p1  ORF type:complete len:308 (-),score=57.61 TRINITY_DN4347_c0_g2_i1:72-995(-)